MKPVRTIGIVNGGGDAPGLKAVIRAVVRSAIYGHGSCVIGPQRTLQIRSYLRRRSRRKLRGKHFSLIGVAESVKMPTTDACAKPIPVVGPRWRG